MSRLATARQALATREEAARILHRRHEEGAASKLESTQSEVLLNQARVELTRLERQREQAHNAIVLIVGMHLPDEARTLSAIEEVIGELAWNEMRLVIAHDPVMAATQAQRRGERIDALIAQGEQRADKLGDQEGAVKCRGRKLSDSGAKARFFHALSEAHLSKIIKVDLAAQLFSYDIDADARNLAEMMHGKLLLVTNAWGLTS